MDTISDIMKELREEKGLKQKDVAIQLHITQQTYSTYETGISELPLHHLESLAKFYNVNCDFLLGRTRYRQAYEFLNNPLTPGITIGEFISHVLAIKPQKRASLIDYVLFLKDGKKSRSDKG